MKENLILCNLFTTLYPKSLYIEFILTTHAPRQSLFEMLNPGLCCGSHTAQLGLGSPLSFKGFGLLIRI